MMTAKRAAHYAAWLCLLGLLGCADGSSVNPSFPQRPIKLIVPFAPGGGSDTFARIIQKAVEDEQLISQPLVIINVPGAGGTVGSRRVKNARADGYTLLLLHEGIITSKFAGQVSYGHEAFLPIAGTGSTGAVICVDKDSPYQSLNDLVTAASQQPDRILFSCSIGAPSQFAGLMLEQSSPGCRFRYVQSGGGAKRFAGIQGGHADVTSLSLAEYAQFKESGLRALAILDAKRHPDAPEVPTAVEQGFDVLATNMQFWWAPKGTSPDKIEMLAGVVRRAMESPEVQERLSQLMIEPVVLQGQSLQEELADRTLRIESVSSRPTTPLPNFPVWTLVIVGVLALWVFLGNRAPKLASSANVEQAKARNDSSRFYAPPSDTNGSRRRVFCVIAIACVYVALMQFHTMGYRLATLLFVVSTGLVLAEPNRRQRSTVVVLALVLSFGLYSVFTQLLVIDLP